MSTTLDNEIKRVENVTIRFGDRQICSLDMPSEMTDRERFIFMLDSLRLGAMVQLDYPYPCPGLDDLYAARAEGISPADYMRRKAGAAA